MLIFENLELCVAVSIADGYSVELTISLSLFPSQMDVSSMDASCYKTVRVLVPKLYSICLQFCLYL